MKLAFRFLPKEKTWAILPTIIYGAPGRQNCITVDGMHMWTGGLKKEREICIWWLFFGIGVIW